MAYVSSSERIITILIDLYHQVAEPVFSENILDESRPDKAGDLPVEKISICSDVVEGGQEVMAFTGNKSTKIPLKQSNFFVEFFELGADQEKGWKSGRIEIPKCDLHALGQILGGLSFKVKQVSEKNHLYIHPSVTFFGKHHDHHHRTDKGRHPLT